MRSFVFTLFLGAIMQCQATEDNKETNQLTLQVGDLAPQLYGGEEVPKDDEIPQLLDTVPNLSGEAICEVQNTRGTGEVQLDSLPLHSTVLSMNEFLPMP